VRQYGSNLHDLRIGELARPHRPNNRERLLRRGYHRAAGRCNEFDLRGLTFVDPGLRTFLP